MFLVLSRCQSEDILFDFTTATDADIAALRSGETNIVVEVNAIRGDKVRLANAAPRSIGIHRREVWDIIRRERFEQRPAASVQPAETGGGL